MISQPFKRTIFFLFLSSDDSIKTKNLSDYIRNYV